MLRKTVILITRSSLDDSLPRQELRYHKMADVLVCPVRQMAGYAGPYSYF